MDDITWPPKKRSTLKVVPGERGTQAHKLSSSDFSRPEPQAPPVYEEPLEQRVEAPEEVIEESVEPETNHHHAPEHHDGERPPKKKKWLFFKRRKLSKKMWALVICGLVVLLAGGTVGAIALYNRFREVPPEPVAVIQPTPEPEPAPAPTTEASRLTGLQVAFELNKRPVTGIMIENSPDARPQSGLKDAGIVYEAIAEGGITRFLALYQEARPDYIGPVRSVRPYYLDFLLPFDGGIAHAGGSPEALSDIKSLGVKDLDQFANSGSYRRVSNRFAPHNLYTDFDSMDALNTKKGYTSSTFTSFTRKEEKPAETPTAKVVDFAISSTLYNVHYEYDKTTNTYLRNQGGAAHRDEKSGAQLAPKVVVALVMTRGIASDGQHTKYGTTGSGHMFVFQDGTVTEGTWRKADRKAQFSFENATGGPLALNPGQTWISIVDANSDVTYTP